MTDIWKCSRHSRSIEYLSPTKLALLSRWLKINEIDKNDESHVTWPVPVTLTSGTTLLTTAPNCCFRGPSLPSAGATETPACSWRAARRCTWCAWSTGWPACSSCASRASPAPCERRRTWASWTCPRCSAPTSPVLSYPPSRCADDPSTELLLHQLGCTWGKKKVQTKKMLTCFLWGMQQFHSPFLSLS